MASVASDSVAPSAAPVLLHVYRNPYFGKWLDRPEDNFLVESVCIHDQEHRARLIAPNLLKTIRNRHVWDYYIRRIVVEPYHLIGSTYLLGCYEYAPLHGLVIAAQYILRLDSLDGFRPTWSRHIYLNDVMGPVFQPTYRIVREPNSKVLTAAPFASLDD